MIKIEAKEKNGEVQMSCLLEGPGTSIILEALAIMIMLPERLKATSPEVHNEFVLAVRKFAEAGEIIDLDSIPTKGGFS